MSTITWASTPSLPSNYLAYVAFGGGRYVAVAQSTVSSAYSTDGVSWTLGGNTSYNSRFIAYGDGKFVVVPSIGGASTVDTSPDGVTWTQRTLPSSANWSKVAYGNGIWVAITADMSAMATSPDGITWTARTPPGSGTNPDIAFGGSGNAFVITYGTSTGTAWRSTDGITWTSVTMPSTDYWLRLAASSSLFVAISLNSNAVATSPDGTTWTPRVPPAAGNVSKITYGNGVFVAVSNGSTESYATPDGIAWTADTMPSMSFPDLAYGTPGFYALARNSSAQVGALGTMAPPVVPPFWTAFRASHEVP